MKILTLVSAFFLFISFSNAATIKLRTDLWCPYACDPKSDSPGFMVEIAKEVFEKQGIKIQYDLMNWARAIVDVKTGKYDGLVGCSKADVDGFVIPEVAIGAMTSYYYALKNDPWTYKDKDSLVGRKIGVINDYTYGDEIDIQVKAKNPALVTVAGDNPLKRMMQMTKSKRLNGFVENPLVFNYTFKKMNKVDEDFKVASKDLQNAPDLFIAFSPANPNSKKYAKILDDGMNELRKNGRLKIILSKYGVSDWK